MLIMSTNVLGNLFREFHWYNLVLAVIIVFGLTFFGISLFQYFMNKEVRGFAEIKGETVVFYCKNEKGDSVGNEEVVEVKDMKRVYVKTIRRRTLMTDRMLEFAGAGVILNKTEVDFLPELFEATEEDLNQLLHHINAHFPEIETGYVNPFLQALGRRK